MFDEKPILNHFIGYAVISPNFFNKVKDQTIKLSDGKGFVKSIKDLIKKNR